MSAATAAFAESGHGVRHQQPIPTGNIVDRILKGSKPSDLPVQALIKYRLAINLKWPCQPAMT
jgi:ABC-type uncharacterized transport system substrate-binding protein